MIIFLLPLLAIYGSLHLKNFFSSENRKRTDNLDSVDESTVTRVRPVRYRARRQPQSFADSERSEFAEPVPAEVVPMPDRSGSARESASPAIFPKALPVPRDAVRRIPPDKTFEEIRRDAFTSQIKKELLCAVNRMGSKRKPSEQTITEVADGFHKVWDKMVSLGFPGPSARERRHFFAQVLSESGNLTQMTEIRPSRRVRRSAGGAKYRGRGPIQLTFCYHYAQYARFLQKLEKGVRSPKKLLCESGETERRCPFRDIAKHPIVRDPESLMGDKAPDKRLAAGGSVFWWLKKKFQNRFFRRALETNDVRAVSKAVNGGLNGLSRRQRAFHAIGGCVHGNYRFESDRDSHGRPAWWGLLYIPGKL